MSVRYVSRQVFISLPLNQRSLNNCINLSLSRLDSLPLISGKPNRAILLPYVACERPTVIQRRI